jgi:hypothetical protein
MAAATGGRQRPAFAGVCDDDLGGPIGRRADRAGHARDGHEPDPGCREHRPAVVVKFVQSAHRYARALACDRRRSACGVPLKRSSRVRAERGEGAATVLAAIRTGPQHALGSPTASNASIAAHATQRRSGS